MKVIISASLLNTLVSQTVGTIAKLKADFNTILHSSHPDLFEAEKFGDNEGEFPSFNNFPEIKNKAVEIRKESDSLTIEINDSFIEEILDCTFKMYNKAAGPLMQVVKIVVDCNKKQDQLINNWLSEEPTE